MKKLSTQELLEILRTLDHRGVSREEVLKALCSDVEKHEEIGEFLVLRKHRGKPPEGIDYGESRDVLVKNIDGKLYVDFYDHNYECWQNFPEKKVLHWYDAGLTEWEIERT